MGAGHSHSRKVPTGSVGRPARLVLTVVLTLVAAGTIFGLVRYWPGEAPVSDVVSSTEFAAPGVTFPVGTVQQILPRCAGGEPSPGAGEPTCDGLVVALPGATVTVSVPSFITQSGLRAGDQVQLLRVPAQAGAPESYSFLQVQRSAPLVVLLVLFVIAVAGVARWKGLLGLVGLGFGGLVLVGYMLPALLQGQPGLRVALVGSTAIMFVVLYLAHGLSIRTSTALAGTLFGVGITALLGVVAVDAARLSGVADDEGATLVSFVGTLDPRELLTCAIIVAGLGVLNDVTITQSSAVWELRAAAPTLSRMQIFRSGMRIGRDHIASTIYTIVFAYAGAALPVIVLMFLYQRPTGDLLQTESLAEEIVRTLASAIGLVLAVPATTAIAAMTVAAAPPEDGSGPSDEAGPHSTTSPRTRAEARAHHRARAHSR